MANLLLFDTLETEMRKVFKRVECNELDDYYKNLNCGCFDIARRKIGDKYFDIFVDDEGLLKEDSILSAITKEGVPMLVGNLIFANHDSEGNTTSLNDKDIEMIQKNTVLADYKGKPLWVVMCEY